MKMHRYEISLKKGQVARKDQPCHWMFEVDRTGLEQVLKVFESESPEKKIGIIKAYRDLTIPDTQVGMIQFPNYSDRKWYKFAAKEFVTSGIADLFATAVVEGRFKNYSDVQLTIWHPDDPIVFLKHKGCDNTKTRECKGSVYLRSDKDPTFGLQRESWTDRINCFEKHLAETPEEEKGYYKSTIKELGQKERTHRKHEEELVGVIRDIKRYLPNLKEGKIYRDFALERFEKLTIGSESKRRLLQRMSKKTIKI